MKRGTDRANDWLFRSRRPTAVTHVDDHRNPPPPPRAAPSRPGMTGLPAVNGADRPTPAAPDGAIRPLPPSTSRAQAGSTAPPPGRGLRTKGADMESMRKTRTGRYAATALGAAVLALGALAPSLAPP